MSRRWNSWKRRWDSIAKPLHSLGKLEDNLVKIAGITGSADIHLEKKSSRDHVCG